MIIEDVVEKGFGLNLGLEGPVLNTLKTVNGMNKELSLEDLRAKLITARANYASCGCKVYREEIAALTGRIKELEAAVKAA